MKKEPKMLAATMDTRPRFASPNVQFAPPLENPSATFDAVTRHMARAAPGIFIKKVKKPISPKALAAESAKIGGGCTSGVGMELL